MSILQKLFISSGKTIVNLVNNAVGCGQGTDNKTTKVCADQCVSTLVALKHPVFLLCFLAQKHNSQASLFLSVSVTERKTRN